MKDWIKKHWASVLYVVFSIGIVSAISMGKILLLGPVLLGIITFLFFIIECIRCGFRFGLKFDRSIVQNPFTHLWTAFLTFVFVFDISIAFIGIKESKQDVPSRVFIDMTSPISLRNEIYNNDVDSITLSVKNGEIHFGQDENTIKLPTNHKKGEVNLTAKKTVHLMLIYLVGLIVFTGLLVATINQFFKTRADRFRNGLTRYLFRKHVLIVGADDIVISLVKSLLKERKSKQIVILTRTKVEKFRNELFSHIEEKDKNRIIMQYGEQTSFLDLTKMHPERANELYIIGDYESNDTVQSQHDESADTAWSRHDADNCTSLQIIKDILEKNKVSKPISCYVMFEHQSMFTTFQFSDFSTELRHVLNLVPFNLYEMIAQKTLITKSLDVGDDSIKPLGWICDDPNGGKGIGKDSSKHVHLVVVGMTPMGTAMALTAAHLCHYPNYVYNKTLKTRITMIDRNADCEMRFFMGRYKDLFSVASWRYMEANPHNTDYFGSAKFDKEPWKTMSEDRYDPELLGRDFLDLEWEFIKGGIEMADVHSYLRKVSKDENTILTVAICVNPTHKAVAGGLYLPEEVYDYGLQVLVYQAENKSLIDLLANTKSGEQQSKRYQKINAFGLEKDGIDLSQFDTTLAQTVNYVYSTVNCESETADGSADYALAKMDDKKRLEEWTKEPTSGKTLAANQWSSIYAANTLWTKLRSIGWQFGDLSSEQVELMAEVEHNRWNVEQLIMNFRPRRRCDNFTSGKEMRANRVHPDLKEYGKLDANTKKFDRAIVKALPYLYETGRRKAKQ